MRRVRRAFWIWNIPNCEGGDPLRIAAEAHNAGLTDVFVKVADGAVKFGVYNKVDKVPAVVQALRGVGIQVWGWQYVYGANPAGEEAVATQRIRELGLDKYIVDAEVEFKQPGYASRAETYLSRLKANNPGVTIAFTSFRFPHYHMEFPWATFFKYCDINIPQVYWEKAHNSGEQTRICIERFRSMASPRLMLAGPAYKWNGWQPTLSEIKEFEQVAESFGIELVAYWSWEHCRRDLPELWPTKPAVPVDDRLVELEKRIAAIKVPISELKNAVAKLETIIENL